VHGTIFSLLKRYVQMQYDHSTWVRLVEHSGLTEVDFDHRNVYPDEHMYALIGQAAQMTGVSADELHEKFGEYLVPDLLYMYQKYIRPEWKTLDMLEHTETTMHTRVRAAHEGNRPPVLDVRRVASNEVRIEYVSPRRMGALAVGIVRGLARHFDEEDRILVEPLTSENGERVQIRVRLLA